MNQVRLFTWKWVGNGRYVTIPFPVLGRIRIEAGMNDGDMADAARAARRVT